MDGPPVGNRWFKVNLHVHGEGNDPAEIVRQAREAKIDLLAVTDHQSFDYCDAVIAAAGIAIRSLTVLPGIEVTSHEGVHVLAVFPQCYGAAERTRLLGWLEITGGGDTKIASSKNLLDIFEKARAEGGIVIVPHPFTAGIGMLDSARKLSTKVQWLESGHVGLIQISEDKVQYVHCDEEGNWINRYVLSSANRDQIRSTNYCLAPFSRSDSHKPEEIADGCSWFRMVEPTVEGLKQVCCEPRSRISRTLPPASSNDAILAMRVTGGYSDGLCYCRQVKVLDRAAGDSEPVSIVKIGPDPVFGRVWQKTGMGEIIGGLASVRRHGFHLERAVYLSVLHRLFVSGSDRAAEAWKENYRIPRAEQLALQQLYRAMAWLGEEIGQGRWALRDARRI